MKLLLSGGHLTPALAFVDFLQQQHPQDTLVFVGRIYSKAGSQQLSQEKSEMEKRGITFIPFSSTKLSQNTLLQKIISLPRLLVSTVVALKIFASHKPDLFLSFGGYLAVPLTLAAWVMRVPVITHEQTRTAGVANSIIAQFAQVIALSYTESLEYFSKYKTMVTGSLIRKSVLNKTAPLPNFLKKQPSKPILYITGGSQGSEILNNTIAQITNTLVKDWFVIHQCGKPTKNRNYFKELQQMKQQLPLALKKNYVVREWVSDTELAWIYAHAHCIVSRAGANTTQEIALARVPAILIPLPFSHNDEQYKNAQALADNKQAILLEQKHLTPETLLSNIDMITKFSRKYKRNLELYTPIKNSEEKLYKLIVSCIHK